MKLFFLFLLYIYIYIYIYIIIWSFLHLMNDFKMQFTSKLFFYPNRGLINGVLILGLVRSF